MVILALNERLRYWGQQNCGVGIIVQQTAYCTCPRSIEIKSVQKKNRSWLTYCYQNVLREKQKWGISEECFNAI